MDSALSIKFHSPEQKTYFSALVDSVIKYYGQSLKSLVLFGSMANGKNRLNSDCDLLIIISSEEKLSRSLLNRDFSKVELPLEYLETLMHTSGVSMEISPIILYAEEAVKFNPLYLDMINDHIPIYDDNNFFSSVMMDMKEKFITWGSTKHNIGNGWYWVIKKDTNYGDAIDYDQ